MNIIKYLMIAGMLLLGSQGFCESRKSPAVRSLSNFVWALKDYHSQSGGEYPGNWGDFNKVAEERFADVIVNAKKYLDIENRYMFFEEPPVFEIHGDKMKFVMIANDSVREGARILTDENGVSQTKPGRYLIVERANGELGTIGLSEISLKRLFTEKGLSLDAYTKNKSKKSTDMKQLPESLSGQSNSSKEPREKSDNRTLKKAERGGIDNGATLWPYLAGIAILILVGVALFRIRAKKK